MKARLFGDLSALADDFQITSKQPALYSPPAALGGRDIAMRLEFQALPKAVAGNADQNQTRR
jgi:hypothetical protein